MKDRFDVVIAGGGPAGSTAAIVLARAGFSVCLLEKERHPRLHIGESILPRNMMIIRELGLEEELRKLPHVPKYGAEFGFGNDHKTHTFSFRDGLIPGMTVFNIERAYFDKMLIDQARAAGAEVHEETPVKSILKLAQDDVEVATADRTIKGRVLLDASGHGTIVGRHLNLRRNFEDPELQKVAYYQHFENVERLPGEGSGHPTIIMCEEGWFWLIGLTETKTSVGFVTRPSFVRTLDIPPSRLLMWALTRCPVVRHRMRNAVGSPENVIVSDFSYRCAPFAGPGYFMLGDAACFLDPIFSTGVTLAMVGAKEGAELTAGMLQGRIDARTAQKRYCRFVERSTAPFWRLIRNYYRHSFRELFVHGKGPMQLPGAIISVLAGQVFPNPPWSLRWRHRMFDFCVWLQQYRELSPHHEPCRLVREQPIDLPLISKSTVPSAAAAPFAAAPSGKSRPNERDLPSVQQETKPRAGTFTSSDA